MANVLDYLDWYGDVPLDAVPFNEVDNAALAQLSYCAFEGVVPTVAQGGSISMGEAAQRFLEVNGKEEIYGAAGVVSPLSALLPQKLAAGKRFGGARLSRFHSRFDVEESEQLCAFHVELPDGSTYVTFRGTDDTLVGWREDFEMTYSQIPSQTDAATYVNATCKDIDGPLMLGGHSKGGNLAVFAGATCDACVREKIVAIWNNDGPGFDPEILPDERLDPVRGLVRTYVPEFDVVGQLLSVGEPTCVVASDERGVMQHSLMSWQVLGQAFVEAPGILPEAQAVNRAFDAWLGSADREKRRHVFGTFFDALQAAGVKGLSDLMSGDPAIVTGVTAQIAGAEPEVRDYIMDLLGILASDYMQTRVSQAAQVTTETMHQLLDGGATLGGGPVFDETGPLDPAEMRRYQRYIGRKRTLSNLRRWLGLDRPAVRAVLGAAAGATTAALAWKALKKRV
ncbi:Mbeg1-like protein [Atopobiaceae bacterium 24-176]